MEGSRQGNKVKKHQECKMIMFLLLTSYAPKLQNRPSENSIFCQLCLQLKFGLFLCYYILGFQLNQVYEYIIGRATRIRWKILFILVQVRNSLSHCHYLMTALTYESLQTGATTTLYTHLLVHTQERTFYIFLAQRDHYTYVRTRTYEQSQLLAAQVLVGSKLQ